MTIDVLKRHLTKAPKWFIVGGPNQSGEARGARNNWPNAEIIGIEPDAGAVEWQQNNGWPEGATLLCEALSNKIGQTTLYFRNDDHKHATVSPKLDSIYGGSRTETVDTITLDSLDKKYGPFEDVVLWLDIEGGEYLALLGAQKLFKRKAIILVYVEMICSLTNLMKGIPRLMEKHGFTMADQSGTEEGHHIERIYTL